MTREAQAFDLIKRARKQRVERRKENDALRAIIGARMRSARTLNGMSQEDCAKDLGYSNSTQLSLAEKGDRLPPTAILVRASEVYGVSMDYLMGLSDEPERDPRAAERNARFRQVNTVIESTGRTIVTAVLSHMNSGPTVITTRHLIRRSEALVECVENLRKLNLKAFDEDLRGSATVMRAVDELMLELSTARRAIDHHERVLETAIQTAEARLGIERPLFEPVSEG